VLTTPAAFTRQTGEAHWHILLRARAIENGAWVVSAAQGGRHEDGRETFGHSMIVDPWGRIVAEADHDEPCVVVADIDIKASAEARAKIPNLRNARDFTVRTAGLAPVEQRKAS
jgi:predicted amidohydrolase